MTTHQRFESKDMTIDCAKPPRQRGSLEVALARQAAARTGTPAQAREDSRKRKAAMYKDAPKAEAPKVEAVAAPKQDAKQVRADAMKAKREAWKR